MRSDKSKLLAVSLLLAALFLSPSADAQYFGRNKVQWESFDFKVLQTEHFDIYYYSEEAAPAQDVGRMAERWYDRLSKIFGHEFARKPIVVYANHADFQQTTTTGGLIGEGTGGFTDAFQNRIVLPLTGVYSENDHVLGHEMVHVFQYDISARTSASSRGQRNFQLLALPLWMIEGLAEYLSQGRYDPQTSMWLRDATIHNRLPDLRRLSGDRRLSPYQYGQAFWAYIGGRFGDEQVIQLFLASGFRGIEPAFRNVLGIPAEEVFKDWQAAARLHYEPVIARRWAPNAIGDPILSKEKTGGDLNVSPSVSPDGKWVAYLSTRDLFSISLYLADAQTGKVAGRLVSEESNPHFDALRFIDSAGGWSPDSRKLAFVVFEKGDNRLAVVDVNSRKIENRIAIPGVSALANPVWSPDGSTIAFSGQVGGVTDLFLYDLDSKKVRRLTNDAFGDLQPAWSPDGRRIAFVSERGSGTDLERLTYGPLRISIIDVGSGSIETVPLFADAKHINPQFSPDGASLYFIANPEGVSDVFRSSINGGPIVRITNTATGISGITETSPALSVSSRSGRMLFTMFDNGRYSIYSFDQDRQQGQVVPATLSASGARAATLPPTKGRQADMVETYLESPTEGLLGDSTLFPSRRYRPDLHLNYLGPPTVGVGADSTGFGVGGSVSAYFGDVLGKHQVGVTFQGGGSSSGFANSFGGELFYLNQERRVHYGAAVSHFPYGAAFTTATREEIVIDNQPLVVDVYRQFRDIVTIDEATLLSQYPLGLTRRFEANGTYTHQSYTSEVLTEIYTTSGQFLDSNIDNLSAPPNLTLYRGSVAYVGDSSIFGFVSPIKGTRYRFEPEVIGGDLKFQTALADYRKYWLARPVTFAVRGLFYGRYGEDAENERIRPLSLARGQLVRGYESDSFHLSECGEALNENRCPVFDRLNGSKIGVLGAEVRVPLFGTEEYGLFHLEFLPTELFGFVDAGVAWTENESAVYEFTEDSQDRIPVASAGVGVRIVLGGYIPLQFYYAFPFQRPGQGTELGFAIAPGW